MFGSIKKAMALGAVVAVGALAGPAMASADGTWTFDSSPIASEDVVAHGSLTLVPDGSPLRVTCDVTLDVTLSNPDAQVQVNGADFDNCVTNFPGCAVTATALGTGSTLPWTGTGDALSQTLTVNDVYFVNSFSGCPDPLGNNSLPEAGTLSPTFDSGSQQISFDGSSATGELTGPLGTAWVLGDLDVTTPNGEVLELS